MREVSLLTKVNPASNIYNTMNAKALACFFLVLQCLALAANASRIDGRQLLARASAKSRTEARSNDKAGRASATANVKVRNGSATAIAKATSEALSSAKNAIAKAVSEAYATVPGGQPAIATAKAKAEAIGKAVAEVYTSSLVAIKSDTNDVEACGSSASSAQASATALAAAFTKAVAKATNYYQSASLTVLQKAIAKGTAKVAAVSYSEACLRSKGYAISRQTAYAKAYIAVYVKAFSNIAAGVRGAKGAELAKGVVAAAVVDGADAGSTDQSTIVGEGFARGGSDAFAETDDDISLGQLFGDK